MRVKSEPADLRPNRRLAAPRRRVLEVRCHRPGPGMRTEETTRERQVDGPHEAKALHERGNRGARPPQTASRLRGVVLTCRTHFAWEMVGYGLRDPSLTHSLDEDDGSLRLRVFSGARHGDGAPASPRTCTGANRDSRPSGSTSHRSGSMDSSSVSVLVVALGDAGAAGVRFGLDSNLSPSAARVLDIASVRTTLMSVEPDAV